MKGQNMAARRNTTEATEAVADTPDAPPVDELIARFQLDTERLIEAFKAECQRRMGKAEHRAALLYDEVAAIRQEVGELRAKFADNEARLRSATNECNTALRRAVDYAEQARTSAAVYERLKEAQPDFRLEVFGLRKEVAGLRDRQTLLEERNNAVRGDTDRIDETLCRVKETAEMTARTLVGRHYLTQPSGAAPAQD